VAMKLEDVSAKGTNSLLELLNVVVNTLKAVLPSMPTALPSWLQLMTPVLHTLKAPRDMNMPPTQLNSLLEVLMALMKDVTMLLL